MFTLLAIVDLCSSEDVNAVRHSNGVGATAYGTAINSTICVRRGNGSRNEQSPSVFSSSAVVLTPIPAASTKETPAALRLLRKATPCRETGSARTISSSFWLLSISEMPMIGTTGSTHETNTAIVLWKGSFFGGCHVLTAASDNLNRWEGPPFPGEVHYKQLGPL